MELISEVTQKLERLRDMKAEIAPMLNEIAQLEKEVKSDILDTGEIPEVDCVTVKIRNGYSRQSWDSKALQGYAAAHPEIMQFCSESSVAPSVALTFK